MQSVIQSIEEKYKKPSVVDVRSGDTVKVHQKIREGSKERIQIFEGLVIRTDRKNSHTSAIAVRRIASGVGVEKTYLIHSPLVTKIEVTKRSKVRRNYLSYMRARTGKSARLSSVAFDREGTNFIPPEEETPEPDVPSDLSAEANTKEETPPEEVPEKTDQPHAEVPAVEKIDSEAKETDEPDPNISKAAKNKKPGKAE